MSVITYGRIDNPPLFFNLINNSNNYRGNTMSVEKSFNEFMIIHEKKLMTKDVNALENDIISATNRSSSVLGSLAGSDLDEASAKLLEGLTMFKKVLAQHELYEI